MERLNVAAKKGGGALHHCTTAPQCILGAKRQFFGHNFLTIHRNELPIAALYSG
jgi:hypothetical protein